MASSTPLLLLLLFTLLLTTATSIPESELESSLAALRSKSYNLFGNAITTSDLRFEVLSGTSFTFFAPLDRALFSLDMTTSASLYVSTLRYHVVPRRLSFSDLQSLPRSTFQTMLPMHHLTVITSNTTRSGVNVTVNGVEVVLPGIYYGKNIAVHGLNGILDHRSVPRTTDSIGAGDLSPASVPVLSGLPPEFQPLIVNRPIVMPPEYGKRQAPSSVPEPSGSHVDLDLTPSAPPSSYTTLSQEQFQMSQDPRMSSPATTPRPALDRTSPGSSPDFMLPVSEIRDPMSPSSDTSTSPSPLQLPIYQGSIPGLVDDMGWYAESDLGLGCGGMQSELVVGEVGPAFSLPSNGMKSEA